MKTLNELNSLNNDELRVTLAQLDGWTLLPGVLFRKFPNVTWQVFEKSGKRASLETNSLPNYPSDLNECAKLEAVLPFEKRIQLVNHYNHITLHEPIYATYFLTPRQRTIGLILTLQEP